MRTLTSPRSLDWTLRVGAFLCFVGHGAFGITTKAAWVPYFAVVGIGEASAYRLMPVIGSFDIAVGVLTLIQPRPALTIWMLVWTMWTALLRPLSGEPVWEALERAGNYGVPAAMLMLGAWPGRALLAPTQARPLTPAVLQATTRVLAMALALLLLGHGALGIIGKPGLVTNFASIMPAALAAQVTPIIGWCEVGMAVAALAWRSVPFMIALALWKLATELLFATAGAPFWEVVERGGSYAVPLALSLVTVLLAQAREPALTPSTS